MDLKEIVAEDGRIWVKSEWAPASQDWPAVSFSKRTVGDYLRQEFKPGRDAILYIGTGSPATTEKPEHRQRMLSAVSIEPMQVLETRECVPADSWEFAQQNYRGRWFWSMPAISIWNFIGFPRAHDVIPLTYRKLGFMENRGNVVELAPGERSGVLNLSIVPVPFERPRKVAGFQKTRAFLNLDDKIRRDIGRMAAGILGRVAGSGSEHTSTSPTRTMTEPDIHVMLGNKWIEQGGLCYLCHGPLVPASKNYLLQSSPDRLESGDVAYSDANTHITHLGCNLAKNKVTLSDFEDWLMVVRGEWGSLITTAE